MFSEFPVENEWAWHGGFLLPVPVSAAGGAQREPEVSSGVEAGIQDQAISQETGGLSEWEGLDIQRGGGEKFKPWTKTWGAIFRNKVPCRIHFLGSLGTKLVTKAGVKAPWRWHCGTVAHRSGKGEGWNPWLAWWFARRATACPHREGPYGKGKDWKQHFWNCFWAANVFVSFWFWDDTNDKRFFSTIRYRLQVGSIVVILSVGVAIYVFTYFLSLGLRSGRGEDAAGPVFENEELWAAKEGSSRDTQRIRRSKNWTRHIEGVVWCAKRWLGPVMASDSPVLRGWYMLIWVNFQWVETKIQSIGTLNRLWTLREGNGERERYKWYALLLFIQIWIDMAWCHLMSLSDILISHIFLTTDAYLLRLLSPGSCLAGRATAEHCVPGRS